MKTWAIIDENGLVLNCIVANNQEVATEMAHLVNENYQAIEYFLIDPGWSYINNSWVIPS